MFQYTISTRPTAMSPGGDKDPPSSDPHARVLLELVIIWGICIPHNCSYIY